jgi:hypothetical protein
VYKYWHFSRGARSPLVKKIILKMTLGISPVMVYDMVSYIENRGMEKYHLLSAFFYYYISFFILLMLSKERNR